MGTPKDPRDAAVADCVPAVADCVPAVTAVADVTCVTVVVVDGMPWDAYEQQVMDTVIDVPGPPVAVTWDLTGLTRVPWEHLGNQVALMGRLRPVIWSRIHASTIRLRSRACKAFLDTLFTVYTPQRPVHIELVA